jgi:hypothetical protein
VGDDIIVDSETFLMTDFVNLKNKPTQSFRYIYESRMCVYVLIGMNILICINTYIYTVFLKQKFAPVYIGIVPPTVFHSFTRTVFIPDAAASVRRYLVGSKHPIWSHSVTRPSRHRQKTQHQSSCASRIKWLHLTWLRKTAFFPHRRSSFRFIMPRR